LACANWLYVIAALVFAMVLLGRRGRGSPSPASPSRNGRPVTGVIPPLSAKTGASLR